MIEDKVKICSEESETKASDTPLPFHTDYQRSAPFRGILYGTPVSIGLWAMIIWLYANVSD